MPVIQITMSEGRTAEQKRWQGIHKAEETIRILIYKVSKENWGNAGVLGLDMI